mmetsp:Transcript_36363/g.71429  ORF Transcript_36363/g.71429 Transcript_36363/m.71429 type:complete len:207 (-) Transcript_36363:202-822(-)
MNFVRVGVLQEHVSRRCRPRPRLHPRHVFIALKPPGFHRTRERVLIWVASASHHARQTCAVVGVEPQNVESAWQRGHPDVVFLGRVAPCPLQPRGKQHTSTYPYLFSWIVLDSQPRPQLDGALQKVSALPQHPCQARKLLGSVEGPDRSLQCPGVCVGTIHSINKTRVFWRCKRWRGHGARRRGTHRAILQLKCIEYIPKGSKLGL